MGIENKQGMLFIKLSTLTICCLLAASAGFSVAELSLERSAVNINDSLVSENGSTQVINTPDTPNEVSSARTAADSMEEIKSENTSQHSKDPKEELQKLKEALNQGRDKLTELKIKHQALNKTLEDLGEISPRELAKYVDEPFDLMLTQLNSAQFEAFEAFFRSEEKTSEAIDYELLITEFFASREGEHSTQLYKVDCRLNECKLFVYSSELSLVTTVTADMRKQAWASGFIMNGFRTHSGYSDDKKNTAFIFSFLVATSAG